MPNIICTLFVEPQGFVSMAMELPHPTHWREADEYLSMEIKNQILKAYIAFHARGILHGQPKREHILIGGLTLQSSALCVILTCV